MRSPRSSLAGVVVTRLAVGAPVVFVVALATALVPAPETQPPARIAIVR